MNIKSSLFQILALFSSIQIVYTITSVELFKDNYERIFKQSNWKVSEQIQAKTEKIQQFGMSVWFKTKENQNEKDIFSLIDISTASGKILLQYPFNFYIKFCLLIKEKRIFGINARIEDSKQILLPYANQGQTNLKLNGGNDEWRLLVITFQQEVFVQIFSVMNNKYSEEKIRYKLLVSFQIENLYISLASSSQSVEYNSLFLYYSEQNQQLDFLQSYIINTAISKNDCKRIEENKFAFNDIRYTCSDSRQRFNFLKQNMVINNKIIQIISFNLAEYKYSYNNKNILFKLNTQYNLLLQEKNNQQHLQLVLNNQQHYLGLIENKQCQITLQIEFGVIQEYYYIQYYQNQYLKGETHIKKMIPTKDNKYKDLIFGKQDEELQITNIILLTNFKIIQTQQKNQFTSGCLLMANPITENIKDSHICIFYEVKNNNQNILELKFSSLHQKRNLQTHQFIHGSNMRSIVRNSYTNSQFKSTITSAQSLNTVMIVGYFKFSPTNSGAMYISIITVGVLSDYYNMFTIFMKANTSIELRYIDDVNNSMKSTHVDVTFNTNIWFGIGLVYSKSTTELKLVFTNSTTYKFESPSDLSQITIPTSIQTLDVCITCIIDGGVFSHFEGSVSSVKIIYDVEYSSVNSYSFFNEYTGISKAFILSTSFNINTYTPNSEYNLGQGFNCNLNYAFYEGICIDQNNCITLFQDQDNYSSFEIGKFFKSASKQCINCSSNCLECSSTSVCTKCRSSYKIVNGGCLRCDDSNKCSSSCPGQKFDPMNQMCVDNFNPLSQQLSNLLLSSRIITDNSDVLVDNSPSFSSINDQIVHCYIDVDNNPMTLISFLGGAQFTTSTVIKKSYNQNEIPKGYQKSVSFYVLFYGNGSPSNLQVKINSNLINLDSQQSIVSNQISCNGSGTETQSIFKVKFVIQDYQNTFDLEIQSTSSKWGIRNLNFEIQKCHPTCNSCKAGGNADDCTTCQQDLTINQFQCNCPFGKYAKYDNCFNPPCVVCSSCSILNCQRCEDITGNCTECTTGYKIKENQCIQDASCNDLDYPNLNFCIMKLELAFTHFRQDRIIQYVDYWKFYNNIWQLYPTLGRQCAPPINLSNQHNLQITLPNYFSYHYGVRIAIELCEYGSIDEVDYSNFYDGGQQIFSQCFHTEKNQPPNDSKPDAIFLKNIDYQKSDNQLDLKFVSVTDEDKPNESQSFSQTTFLYFRCHPMCKKCNGDTAANCLNCIDNAYKDGGNNCKCNDGYYFSYIRYPSINSLPGNCLKCNSACNKCTGPSQSDCTECSDGYASDGNTCKYKCQDGEYWNQPTLQCLSCHGCCRTCVNNQINNCHDCHSGFSFKVSDNSCIFQNAQCKSSCAVATNSLCGGTQSVHNNCLSNSWVVYDANVCVQCGKFVNNKCGGEYQLLIIKFCEEKGYQFNFDSNNCSSCSSLESGISITDGVCGRAEIKDSCKSYGWKLFDDDKCIDCNSNSPTFNMCVCHSTCSTCSRFQSPFHCLTCKPSYYLYKNQECLPNCPNGYMIAGLKCLECTDKQMPTCVNCYRACLKCDPFIASVIPNTCTACSTLTRKLVNQRCECLDSEDTRESFHECSYQNIAVLNAILSNTSPLLTINFGKELNIPNTFQADVYSSSLCEYLFSQKTKEQLGSGLQCKISGQNISVKLSVIKDDNSLISDGELIYFEKNKLSFVKSSSTLIDTFLNNMVVQTPIIGQTKVSFDYLSIENSCNDIHIKLKSIVNDAGRGFKQIKWSIQSYLPANPTQQSILEDLLQIASTETRSDLLIMKGIIKPDEQVQIMLKYTLKANVMSYEVFDLSVKMEKIIFLDVQSTAITPFFRYQSAILVFSQVIKICDPFGIRSIIEPLNMSISSNEFQNQNYKNSNYVQNSYQIELLPYSLQTGKITFNFNTKLVSNSFIESEIKYEIDVQLSSLYVKIVGGNGYFSYQKSVTINGFVRDYDIQSETDPQGVDIEWQCIDYSTKNPCKNISGSTLVLDPNILTATIKEFTFEPYTSVKINFIGKKTPRQSTDEITILFSELDLPALGVDMSIIDTKKTIVNLNEEIFVHLNYESSVNVDLLSYSGTISYENKVVGIIKFDFTSLRFQIWNYFSNFKRNSIQFQIRFNVFNPQYYMPSMFLTTLNVNFPPNKCKFTVTPNTGNSVETKFIMQLLDCEDENQPIYYQFFYYQSFDEFEYEKKNPLQVKRRQLNDKQQNVYIETSLPSGQLLVLAQAIDSQKAIYNTTLKIDVKLKIYDESTYISLIQQKLDQVKDVQVSSMISDISIISDDILKRDELKSSSSLNSKKLEILNLLDTLQKDLSPLSTFSTTADKAKTSLTQSGITYSSSESQNLLTKMITSLDDSSKFQQSNLEISKEKLKQKLYDSFQVVDTFGKQDSNTQSSEKMLELTDKIGGYLFKNILPNEDPINFQGNQINIFGTQMTEKYVCTYFFCETSTPTDSTKKVSIYNLKKSEYINNPFSQDDTFLNYTNSLKEQNPDITITNFPVIDPAVSNNQNIPIDSFSKSAILSFPVKSGNFDKNVTCLQKKKEKGWTKNGCSSIYKKTSNSYVCVCDELSPTTVIDDLEELINNKNLETAFSSDGISNIMSFSEFYKFIAFWLLSFQTILFIAFYYKGYKLDSIDKLSKSDQINNSNPPEQSAPKKSKFSKNKLVPLNINQTGIEDGNENILKNETVQTEIEQINFDTPPLRATQSIQNDALSQKSKFFKETTTQQPQIVQNIENETQGIDIFQLNHDSNNQILKKNYQQNTQGRSSLVLYQPNTPRKVIISQQLDSQNVADDDNTQGKVIQTSNSSINSNKSTKDTKEKIIIQKNGFAKLPTYKQVMIFHNFFGIFLLFNPNVPRTLRFLMFYVRSIHSLGIAVVFDQSYSAVQKVAIAIFNAVTIIIIIKIFEIGFSIKNIVGKVAIRIIAISVILGYYYIILSIVSGQDPSDSNQFFTTFILFYSMDLFVFSLISALVQRLIARKILKEEEIEGIKKKLYKLIQLQLILISVR